MYCPVCGAELKNNVKFCTKCGANIAKDLIPHKMQLRCQSCDGLLDLDENEEILFCPFCGSKELLIVSDAVKIEKIRNRTIKEVELGKQRTYKDIKIAEMEIESIERQEKSDNLVGIIGGILFFLACLAFFLLAVKLRNFI